MTSNPPATRTTGPGPTSASFQAIGTTNRILVTEPAALIEATLVAKEYIADLDAAISRFRRDSEVSRLAARATREDAWAFASEIFVDHLSAGIRAARLTDGLVDFTVGSALIASGYDTDMAQVRARETYAGPRATGPVVGWQQVTLDELTNRVSTPRGVVIDLGSVAKAHAADVVAARLAARLPGGFLVNLGGDIAVAGPAPVDGWRVGVEYADGSVAQVIAVTEQGVATSSTQLRAWAADSGRAHHIIDPRTGRTANTPWAQVTCVGANAMEANTASTAALVLGQAAPAWLEGHGIPARLDHLDGSVTFVGGWPEPEGLPMSDLTAERH